MEYLNEPLWVLLGGLVLSEIFLQYRFKIKPSIESIDGYLEALWYGRFLLMTICNFLIVWPLLSNVYLVETNAPARVVLTLISCMPGGGPVSVSVGIWLFGSVGFPWSLLYSLANGVGHLLLMIKNQPHKQDVLDFDRSS